MSELPAGWTRVSVDTLAAREPRAITDGPFGSNLKTEHYTDSGPRVIRLQNIGEGRFNDERAHISDDHFASLRQHEARGGDVLVAMLGDKLPRACLVPSTLGPAIVKADCARVRVNNSFALPPFVTYALNSEPVRRGATELIHGIGRPRLGLNLLRTVEVPVAPIAEQHRIVEAIESYLSRLDETTTLLERVQRNLKRYRASVLKAAVEGRLVPTEAELARAEKRDYEPASVLLRRILVERRQRWEKEGRRGKYEEPEPPDTTGLPQLPHGWCWSTADALSDATRSITYGVVKLGDEVEGGTPILRSSNVRHLRLDVDYVKPIAESIESQYRRTRLQGGEVLVTVRGTLGGVAMAPKTCRGFNISREVAMLALVDERIAPITANFIASPVLQAWMMRHAKGITYQGVNIETLKLLPVPLPPLDEQHRIVNEVDRCLSMAEDTLSVAVTSERRCQRLRQSILKWAFEGKLVDQDPNDEPASALLARIKGAPPAPAPRTQRKRGAP